RQRFGQIIQESMSTACCICAVACLILIAEIGFKSLVTRRCTGNAMGRIADTLQAPDSTRTRGDLLRQRMECCPSSSSARAIKAARLGRKQRNCDRATSRHEEIETLDLGPLR